jgi:hypothetical protein
MIRTKRVYDAPVPEDGARFLVERLWPRGLKKADVPMDNWPKDVAPSTALRRWSCVCRTGATSLQTCVYPDPGVPDLGGGGLGRKAGLLR